MLRDRLQTVFTEIKDAAAMAGDENMIALIHQFEARVLSSLTGNAYLDPDGPSTSSALLDGTPVPLATLPATLDSSTPIIVRQRIDGEKQEISDLQAVENPNDEQKARLEALREKHPDDKPHWTRAENEDKDLSDEELDRRTAPEPKEEPIFTPPPSKQPANRLAARA